MTIRWPHIVIALLCCLLAVAAPLSAGAQQGGQVYRVGILCSITCASADVRIFRERLFALGHRERGNIAFECRSADRKLERLPDLASDLVKLNVDVVFTTWGTGAAQAARRASATIPIVVGSAGDLVATGLVTSLDRPGGNVTGTSSLALELEGKRLELLKELMPTMLRVAVFWDSRNSYSILAMKQERTAADRLGVKLREIQVGHARDLTGAFATILRERLEALSIHAYVPVLASRERIVELAAKNRVVAIYPLRDVVRAGALLSYGADLAENAKRAVLYVGKILKGAKPAELPVEQPTKFELVINMKTAKALGLTISPSLLGRADEVIP